MGVPKFFRWISERYPCLSELIKEYQIPEFDNLYLDMNGIIHTCSHPNDFDPHFRITEEKIFKDIFHYIEILFRMIQPQQLFFMAVDGVAPRAKQNQQRGRRFRSAKEAEELEKKAKEKGEALPSAARFDSNCITPGTPFMVRLQEQLKFFVANKVSTDELWQKCTVVLSGHETPGEGEHKIMDYIRYLKSQPDYNSNTRHCLYGLDADLMMLGLCTHEPHFSLLREEVRFDKKSTTQQRITTAEETTFFLLHLSLMREYLEHEFAPIRDKLVGFEFDLESIIDDWVLMGFLVGNDFIPPLPELHINTGALPLLYQTYMQVLPSLGGYINEQGTLNVQRFQRYMEELGKFDLDCFDEKFADLQYFKEKTGRRPGGKERKNYSRKKMSVLEMEELITFDFAAEERPRNPELEALIVATNDIMIESSSNDDDDDEDDSTDVEVAAVAKKKTKETERDSPQSLMMAEFAAHKRDYYMNKLEYKDVTPEVLRSQATGYVQAIQWNLHYYYNGVCSWSWFYPHHYAPYISDIRDFADIKFDFDMAQPYKPFQQLAAVLPAASKELLPEAYQWLMVSPDSPIIHFYPTEFETDLNGKRQEWEAVVLIPFIEEKALLAAMDQCSDRLSEEEHLRNTHGPMYVYKYTPEDLGAYTAPAYFPTITHNHARVQLVNREDVAVPVDRLVKGLCSDVRLDVYFPGFPTLKHIKHTGSLAKAKVKVFEQPSRGESMILNITKQEQRPLRDIAVELIGQSIYVSWPHLTEALVVCVCTRDEKYEMVHGELACSALNPSELSMWQSSKKAAVDNYAGRRGVELGEVNVLVKAMNMMGRKYVIGQQAKVTLEKQWAPVPSSYILQATVKDITVNDPLFVQYKTVNEVFPAGSQCFIMSLPRYYGLLGTVAEGGGDDKGRLKMRVVEKEEPDLSEAKRLLGETRMTYMQGGAAGAKLGISSHLLSRVTGNIFVQLATSSDPTSFSVGKVNVGLSLKYTKKNEEIPGYTRRDATNNNWLYSQKSVHLVNSYMAKFPQLFEYLSTHVGNDDFREEDICPGAPGTMNTVVTWLKEQDYIKVERQTCGSNGLEKEVVAAVEAALDKEALTEKRSSIHVKPHLLYKPELHTGNLPPDRTTVYALFDRVVNVRKSFTVPFGLKGVIIAIVKAEKEEETLYDVVFDQTFPGGLALNCSANRGYRMPRCALINISHGTRVVLGIAPPTDGAMNAPMDRNRQQVPYNKVFDNSGLNGPPSMYNKSSRQANPPSQNWREKPPACATAPVPAYKVLTNPAPAFRVLSKPAPGVQPPPFARDSAEGGVDWAAEWQNMMPSTRPPGEQPPRTKTQPPKSQPLPQSPSKANHQTDCLKMMLGLSPGQSAPSQPAKAKSQPPVGKAFSVEEIMSIASQSRQAAPQAPLGQPSAPPQPALNSCARLLSVFQTKGLGTPRYNYTTDSTGFVKATLSLPTGKHFVGALAASREQSSDNAAHQALMYLAQEPGRPQTDNLPAPPQNWWAGQPQQQAFVNMPGGPGHPAWSTQQPQLYEHPRPSAGHKPAAARHQPPKPAGGKYTQQTGAYVQPLAPRDQSSPHHQQKLASPATDRLRQQQQQQLQQQQQMYEIQQLQMQQQQQRQQLLQKQQQQQSLGNGHATQHPASSNSVPPPGSQQHLIRVTGAPPAMRERSLTPKSEAIAQGVPFAVSKESVPSPAAPATSEGQPQVSTRMAAKFGKKTGKSKKKVTD